MSSVRAAAGLVAGCLLVGFATACPNNQPECTPACEEDLVCDAATLTCIPPELPRRVGPIPGRAARIASSRGLVWTASIDPESGELVVAEFSEGVEPDVRTITTFSIPDERRVSIAALGNLLAVAWVGPQGRYDLAYRRLPSDHARWRYATALPSAGVSYQGTESFDLELTPEGGAAIAFRDRDGTLGVLRATSPEDEFTLESVDAGGPAADGTSCPDAIRNADGGRGVGIDPDLVVQDGVLAVAYQDADCGDLRFARKSSQRWIVDVVDTGVVTVQTETTRGIVGRWPSLAFGPDGAARIAYHDVSRGRLMYAREDNGSFDLEVADDGVELDAFSRERKGVVGAFAKLTRAADGTSTVTYFDGASMDLKIARRTSGSGEWRTSTLISEGAVGFFADHVVELGAGRFVVAERLARGEGGLRSELVVQRENE